MLFLFMYQIFSLVFNNNQPILGQISFLDSLKNLNDIRYIVDTNSDNFIFVQDIVKIIFDII